MVVRNVIFCLWILAFAAGCEVTPFVKYHHFSQPNVNDDGWDLGCGGIEAGERLVIEGSLCEELKGGGTFGEVVVKGYL